MTTEQSNPLSRRNFIAVAGVATTAALLTPRSLLSASRVSGAAGIVPLMRGQASTAKVAVQSLRGNICVLIGAGGNIAVLTGPDGKLLVDAGISTARPQVTEALNSIGPEPIRHLINTHWHFDHTDGNEWLNQSGARIIAHETTRRRLAGATRVEGWDFTFLPAPPGALPTIGFKSPPGVSGATLSLHLNGTEIVLSAFEPAHTDCDIAVDFSDADVIHVGDIWWNGHYPFIDYSTGGSINGTIRAVEVALARASAKTIIIPGHGPVGDKPQLAEFRDMLVTVRGRVAAQKQQGRSLAEIVAAKPTAEFDRRYGHFLTNPDIFTGLVFAGV
ncbi:MBL fold metallo-hydrolase [soil metagenome]